MKHRILALLLAAGMMLALPACSNSDADVSDTPAVTDTAAPETTVPVESETPAPSETVPAETPSVEPTETPDAQPSQTPAAQPSQQPSAQPSEQPSEQPAPSVAPSETPAQPASGVDLTAFYNSLASKYGENFAATMSLTEMPEYLDGFFPGLSAIPTKQLLAFQPMMGAVVCEIVLVEVENAADVNTVKGILQSRITTQVDGGAWYPESIEGWKNNSRVVSNGNCVMLIAWQYCDEAVSAFNALF